MPPGRGEGKKQNKTPLPKPTNKTEIKEIKTTQRKGLSYLIWHESAFLTAQSYAFKISALFTQISHILKLSLPNKGA